MINRFVAYCNEARPDRSLGRRTPQEVFDAKVRAHPPPRPVDTHFRVRHDVVDKTGAVTLRHDSRLHHIGMAPDIEAVGWVMLVADLDVRVLDEDGALLRHLTLDPTRDYQRQGSG